MCPYLRFKINIIFFSGSLAVLREEENLPARVGFIAGGGILGFLTALIRRRRFFGKTIYTALGAGIFTTILYPEDTKQFGKDVYDEGERLSKIAVNFVQGVAPQDETKTEEDKSSKNDKSTEE